MIEAIQWLQVFNLFAAGIICGGLPMAWKLIVGGLRELPEVTQVRVHQGMLFLTPDYFMMPCGLVAGVTAILIAVFQTQAGVPLGSPWLVASLVFMAIGFVGNIGVMVTSRYFGTRINAIIATWSLDAIPPEYPAMRQKWDKTHFMRMTCGYIAFLGYLLGFLAFKLARAEQMEGLFIALLVLLFVNLFAAALLAGGTTMVALNIAPEKDKMPPLMLMQTHHAMFDLKKDSYMKPVGILAGVSAVLILILLGVGSQLTPAEGVVYGLGLVGFAVIVVTANRFLLPFHARVLTWKAESPPPGWAAQMSLFQNVLSLRLLSSWALLQGFLIGGVVLVK
jgi:hypothetical protein